MTFDKRVLTSVSAPVALGLLSVLCFGCQENMTLATQDIKDDTPMVSIDDSTEEGIPTSMLLPIADNCQVLPMDPVKITDVDIFDDGSIVVGGLFDDEGPAEIVFGRGESGETVFQIDIYNRFAGFVAKYNPDRTLAWVRDGIDAVEEVQAATDGGITAIRKWNLNNVSMLSVVKFNAAGELSTVLDIIGGAVADISDPNETIVAGYFQETVTLGQGAAAVTFEGDLQGSYQSYLARYDLDGSLKWAGLLEGLYVPNDLAVTDETIIVVDNNGSLLHLNRNGEEVWRRVIGHFPSDPDPGLIMINGSFIVWESTNASIAPDGTVSWSGLFAVSVVFNDDSGNSISLTAPYEINETGASGSILPFVAQYTSDGMLLSAVAERAIEMDIEAYELRNFVAGILIPSGGGFAIVTDAANDTVGQLYPNGGTAIIDICPTN